MKRMLAPSMVFCLGIFLLAVCASSVQALNPGLYVADFPAYRIYYIDSNYDVSLFFPRNGELIYGPMFMEQDQDGNLVVALRGSRMVVRVSPTGVWLETLATDLGWPQALAYDSLGNLYVSEYGPECQSSSECNGGIKRISPQGDILTVAEGLMPLRDLKFDEDGNLYAVVESYLIPSPDGWPSGYFSGGILKFSSSDLEGLAPGSLPLTPTVLAEGLNYPMGLEYRDRELIVAENYRIWSIPIDPPHTISPYYPPDGGLFNPTPRGLAFGEDGDLYMTQVDRVSVLDSNLNLTTLATGFTYAMGLLYVPVVQGPPTITSLSPSPVISGGPDFILTVHGTNFMTGSVVQWNNSPRPTTFISSTELTATISAADIATIGGISITVVNPTPERSESNAVMLSIVNPIATLTGLYPGSVTVKGASFTLNVFGRDFVSGSRVRWNGADLATTFVSSTQLNATVPAANIAAAGTAYITVFSPAPGGGVSNALYFTVLNPVPTITGLSPSSAGVGSAAFTLTVNGTNFVSGSVVRWNGTDRVTVVVSGTQVRASITAEDISETGTASVTVLNPLPGGGLSNSLPFSIMSPVPSATSLSQSTALTGGADFILTVTGKNFVRGSVVRWDGFDRPTTFVSNTQVQASISAADIADPGIINVVVFNPSPGGGSSNALSFRIKIATRVELSVDSVFVSSGTKYVKLKARVIDTYTGQPIYGIGYRYIYTYFYLDRRYIGMSRVNQSGTYAGYSIISYKIKSGTHPAKAVFNENDKYGGSETQIEFTVE